MESHANERNSSRSVTLNMLKEQQYSLNMRLLLALRNHNTEEQARLEEELREVQTQIDRMRCGGM